VAELSRGGRGADWRKPPPPRLEITAAALSSRGRGGYDWKKRRRPKQLFDQKGEMYENTKNKYQTQSPSIR